MFINTGKFEKKLKEAYKTWGIKIERTDKIIAVRAGGVYIEADIKMLTNDFKAAIVKFCGDLPFNHEAVTCTEEGMQGEIPGTVFNGWFGVDTTQCKEYDETALILNDHVFFQAEDGDVLQINTGNYAVFDPGKAGKNESISRKWIRFENHLITRSDRMLLALRIVPPEFHGEREIMDALKGVAINFSRDNDERT